MWFHGLLFHENLFLVHLFLFAYGKTLYFIYVLQYIYTLFIFAPSSIFIIILQKCGMGYIRGHIIFFLCHQKFNHKSFSKEDTSGTHYPYPQPLTNPQATIVFQPTVQASTACTKTNQRLRIYQGVCRGDCLLKVSKQSLMVKYPMMM